MIAHKSKLASLPSGSFPRIRVRIGAQSRVTAGPQGARHEAFCQVYRAEMDRAHVDQTRPMMMRSSSMRERNRVAVE